MIKVDGPAGGDDHLHEYLRFWVRYGVLRSPPRSVRSTIGCGTAATSSSLWRLYQPLGESKPSSFAHSARFAENGRSVGAGTDQGRSLLRRPARQPMRHVALFSLLCIFAIGSVGCGEKSQQERLDDKSERLGLPLCDDVRSGEAMLGPTKECIDEP